jgi:Tfp pilus assembly protein PilZ
MKSLSLRKKTEVKIGKQLSILSLFIKNSNLVYTNKPFVSNLICYVNLQSTYSITITLVLIILVHYLNVNLIYTLH